MENLFIGDLHLGHRKVVELTRKSGGYREGATVAEHDDWVMTQLYSVKPDKRTIWHIMGDVAFDEKAFGAIKNLPGRKRLIIGNHDIFPTEFYLQYFEAVLGTHKKFHMWLSHVPIHPAELRSRVNVHGHVHDGIMRRNPYGDPDKRYLNVAIDWVPNHRPMTLEEVRTYFLQTQS
jgi:calcineurin-like phosphoesterase family protein